MKPAQNIDADVVVVGSGVAGAMTAFRLAKRGVRVTVLEAGPRIRRQDVVARFTTHANVHGSGGFPNPDHARRPDWGDPADRHLAFAGPDSTQPEYLCVLGGTTWQWAAAASRLLPGDFTLHSDHGVGRDWPIGYADLAAWYREAEREMGVSGTGADDPPPLPPLPLSHSDRIMVERLAGIGLDMGHAPVARNSRPHGGRTRCQGFGTCSPICPSGAQYAAINHIEAAERLGARVIAEARADRLDTDAAGRITGVAAVRPDGTRITARARTFVIAANGIESPRLLLSSASNRFPAGVANASGQVGRNFHDHLEYDSLVAMPTAVHPGRGPINLLTCEQYRDGPWRSRYPGYTLSAHNHNFVQLMTDQALNRGLAPPGLDDDVRDRIARTVEFVSMTEQLADPANRVTLDAERRDRSGRPGIRIDYRFGEYEKSGFAQMQDRIRGIADQLGARLVAVNGPKSMHSLMGTTIMGDDPGNSVVDAHCRAHDHDNLFVVGASVFPAGGSVGPGLTIAALGLRTADEISRQLGLRDAAN